MAWNPSKEVAAARDAANALKSPMCVIVFLSPDGGQVGMASYGVNKQVCNWAGEFGKYLLGHAIRYGEEPNQPRAED